MVHTRAHTHARVQARVGAMWTTYTFEKDLEMSFDFPWSCPKIDREIAGAKTDVVFFLRDMINDLSPLIPESVREELASGYGKDLYELLGSAFEAVRKTNEDMRSVAEHQIAGLEREIDDLKYQVDALERQI